MITGDDRDHLKPLPLEVAAGFSKSDTFVVRTREGERVAEITILHRDYNCGPDHDSLFLLILRRFGSLSTLSVFLGTKTTGGTGKTLTSFSKLERLFLD